MDLTKLITAAASREEACRAESEADAAAKVQRLAVMFQEHAAMIQAALKTVVMPAFSEASKQLSKYEPRITESRSTDHRLREITVEIALGLLGEKRHLPEAGRSDYVLRYTGDVDRLTFTVQAEIYRQGVLFARLVPVSDLTTAAVESDLEQFVKKMLEREASGF